MQISMSVKGLVIDPASNSPVVLLSESDGERVLPIWVGIFEANAIALKLEGIITPRPMTHDLLRAVIDEAGLSVRKVVISDLQEGTFFARIEVEREGKIQLLDSRPSDAIALALRSSAPIFVEEAVLTAALTRDAEASAGAAGAKAATAETGDSLRRLLEQMPDDQLGKYKM